MGAWATARAVPRRLDRRNVFSLKAFGALFHFKLHSLPFVEGLVAVHGNRGEVHENIFSRLALNETKAFGGIKPLHCSLFLHFSPSLACPKGQEFTVFVLRIDLRFLLCVLGAARLPKRRK